MTRIIPRPYQLADIEAAARRRRVLNSYDCGLGKTVFASRTVEAVGDDAYPCLIACPTYLVDQWADHLRSEGHPPESIQVAATVASRPDPRHPNDPPAQRAVSPEEKQALLDEVRAAARSNAPRRFRWLIVNYESLRRKPATRKKSVDRIWEQTAKDMGLSLTLIHEPDFEAPKPRNSREYRLPPVRSVIADESHRLRGSKSQQFRGVFGVASAHRCGLVIELTATPIYRDVGDLYAQLRILDPRRFTSYWRFIEEYAILDEDPWGTRIIGSRPQAQQLLAQYAIHREYSDPDVQLEIPPVVSRIIRTSMSPKSVAEYRRVKYDSRTRAGELIIDSGTRITELRAITAHDENKLDSLKELIEDVANANRGYIVFCHYRDTADLIGATLGIPIAKGGQKGNTGLAKSVGAHLAPSPLFNPTPRVGDSETDRRRGSPRADDMDRKVGAQPLGLAATIDCLQEGVDLSHLQVVIFYEADYLPGKFKQAMMRVQRWRPSGDQSSPVLLYHFLSRGTIDTHVLKVAHDRGADAETLMRMEMSE